MLPARRVEQGGGLLRVEAGVLQRGVVGPVLGRQPAQRRRRQAVIDRLRPALLVDRHVERLAHPLVGEHRLAAVEVDELHERLRGELRRGAGELPGAAVEQRRDALDHVEDVHLAGLVLGVQRLLVGDVFLDQARHLRRAAMVGRVRRELDVAAGHPALEHIRPGADRVGVEGGGADVRLMLQDVPGHDRGLLPGHEIGRVVVLQRHPDRMVVRRLVVRDVVVAVAAAHGDLRVQQRLEREDHVGGGEGLAVVPGDAGTQLDGPGAAVGADAAVLLRRHLDGEVRDERALRVELPQRVEHRELDRRLHPGVDIEQRVEVDRLLGEGVDHLAGGGRPRPPGADRDQGGGQPGQVTAARHPCVGHRRSPSVSGE